MRNLLPALVSSLLFAAPALAQNPPAAQPEAKAGAAAQPISARASETLKSKPSRDFPNAIRSWDLESSEKLNVRLHEITGTVPMHFHTDTSERIFLIEGQVIMTLGEQKLTLKPGDYVSIPPGVPHKVELPKGTRRALAGGFMVPPGDPKKTTWVEPAPKPASTK
jgi:quercetin dioxygenase-like cupin family protein